MDQKPVARFRATNPAREGESQAEGQSKKLDNPQTVLHPLPQGWGPHSQQVRPHRRYAEYGRPPHLEIIEPAEGVPLDYNGYAMDPRYMAAPAPPQPNTNVSVNNNGNFYRPWKEELALSFGKTVGNFFAWPFRLIGSIFEGIINAGLGILKLVLMAVIAPTLLYTGMQMYEASQNGGSATEAAAQVGKQAIGLMGAVLGGMWDGIFGSEEDTPEAANPEK